MKLSEEKWPIAQRFSWKELPDQVIMKTHTVETIPISSVVNILIVKILRLLSFVVSHC